MRIDVEGFAALGVKVKPRKAEEDVFNIWDINEASWRLFLAVQSQWRVVAAGMGGVLIWLGLDYPGIDVFMRRSAIEDEDGRLWSDLMAMETAALKAFSEARI